MTQNPLFEIKRSEFIKKIARELLVKENTDLDQTVAYICQKFGVSEKEVRAFVNFLYRKGFLVKYSRGKRYSFTLNGLTFLFNLTQDLYFSRDLEDDNYEHRRA
jgi:DNA-binding transcriptional regulator PaaX